MTPKEKDTISKMLDWSFEAGKQDMWLSVYKVQKKKMLETFK